MYILSLSFTLPPTLCPSHVPSEANVEWGRKLGQVLRVGTGSESFVYFLGQPGASPKMKPPPRNWSHHLCLFIDHLEHAFPSAKHLAYVTSTDSLLYFLVFSHGSDERTPKAKSATIHQCPLAIFTVLGFVFFLVTSRSKLPSPSFNFYLEFFVLLLKL